MIKILAFFALLATISAFPMPNPHEEHHEEHHGHPKYKFEYGVKDPHHHDHHSQKEERDGHHLEGEYRLDEADGTHRVVVYHVDGKSGWQAHVHREGHAKHPKHGESWSNFYLYHH